MRSTLITTTLMAALAMAGPLVKRKLVTVTDLDVYYTTVTLHSGVPSYTTVATVTVTGDGSEPTTTVTEGASAPTTTGAALEQSVTPQVAAATTVAPVQAVETSVAAAASATGANAYQNMVLDSHNIHRSNHSADAITWSDSLAATALKIANTCVYGHDTKTDGGGYGQNIGAGTSADNIDSMITNMMYNGEIGFYPQPFGVKSPDMSNFEKWGHFSQIVWKATTEVGCATVSCGTLANTGSSVPPVFTVCNYSPPGNFGGQYDNVGAPLGGASVTA